MFGMGTGVAPPAKSPEILVQRAKMITFIYIKCKQENPCLQYLFYGGGERDRTDDLLLAKQALSQLSYTPIYAISY